MNKLTRTLATTLALLALNATGAFAKSDKAVEPELIGLYFYANWCSSCNALEPQLESATQKLKKQPFLLVQLDVSNKPSQFQAAMTAAALGLGEVYENTGVKTGFVLLVDPKTGEILDRITKDDSDKAIVAKIQNRLS